MAQRALILAACERMLIMIFLISDANWSGSAERVVQEVGGHPEERDESEAVDDELAVVLAADEAESCGATRIIDDLDHLTGSLSVQFAR